MIEFKTCLCCIFIPVSHVVDVIEYMSYAHVET